MEGEWDETLELQKWDLLVNRAQTPAFAGTILYVLHCPFTHCICTELKVFGTVKIALCQHNMQNDRAKTVTICWLTAFQGLLYTPGSDWVSYTPPTLFKGATIHATLSDQQQDRWKACSHCLTYLTSVLAPGSARMLLDPTIELWTQPYRSHISPENLPVAALPWLNPQPLHWFSRGCHHTCSKWLHFWNLLHIDTTLEATG